MYSQGASEWVMSPDQMRMCGVLAMRNVILSISISPRVVHIVVWDYESGRSVGPSIEPE